MSPQSHCKRQSGAALGGLGVAVAGSSDSVPAYAESGSAGQQLLLGSVGVVAGDFPCQTGNLHHCSCVCSPFCNVVGVHIVSGGKSKSYD